MNATIAQSRDSEQRREMPIVDCIHAHSSLCEEVYDFFLEENRLLRSSALSSIAASACWLSASGAAAWAYFPHGVPD